MTADIIASSFIFGAVLLCAIALELLRSAGRLEHESEGDTNETR